MADKLSDVQGKGDSGKKSKPKQHEKSKNKKTAQNKQRKQIVEMSKNPPMFLRTFTCPLKNTKLSKGKME